MQPAVHPKPIRLILAVQASELQGLVLQILDRFTVRPTVAPPCPWIGVQGRRSPGQAPRPDPDAAGSQAGAGDEPASTADPPPLGENQPPAGDQRPLLPV